MSRLLHANDRVGRGHLFLGCALPIGNPEGVDDESADSADRIDECDEGEQLVRARQHLCVVVTLLTHPAQSVVGDGR